MMAIVFVTTNTPSVYPVTKTHPPIIAFAQMSLHPTQIHQSIWLTRLLCWSPDVIWFCRFETGHYMLVKPRFPSSSFPQHWRMNGTEGHDINTKQNWNKAVYTPPQSRTGGQEWDSKKTLPFCFGYEPTNRPTDRPTDTLRSRVASPRLKNEWEKRKWTLCNFCDFQRRCQKYSRVKMRQWWSAIDIRLLSGRKQELCPQPCHNYHNCDMVVDMIESCHTISYQFTWLYK